MKTKIIYIISGLFCFAILFVSQQSCYRKFYKVSDASYAADPAFTFRTQPEKYYILRSGNSAFHMQNIVLDSSGKSLSCTLGRLTEEHLSYLIANKKSAIHYKPSKESEVLNEVHIYMLQGNRFSFDSSYVIDFKRIAKIEILEKDKGRTTTSTVVSTAGIALFVTSMVLILTSSSNEPPPAPAPQGGTTYEGSCPFVSTYNGEGFYTQGELYPGALYPQLARNDYLSLTMQPVSEGKLQIQLSNHQQEVQHTDLAELMVITHDKGVQMMVGQDGSLFSVANPVSPVSAVSNNKDILHAIAQKDDDLVYAFDDTSENTHINPAELTFNNYNNSKKAKLILKVRNAYWIDYVFNKMTEGYGTYYGAFVKKQHDKTAGELYSWMNAQSIPLTVSVQTASGWEKVSDMYAVGPLSFRETIVPLDLTNIPGNDVHVRLSCGFLFWELDYAAIDFSENENFTIEKLLPVKAIDENGNDVTALLTGADERYLIQPVPGNLTTIDYAYSNNIAESKAQSYVLHSKGYYEYVRDYKNKPDVAFLKQFKQPGSLSNYSMALYKKVINDNYINFAVK